ncbi:MAG: hypothetical protein KGZ75_03700 [Syntrophomonadaceae bacterium]|nr:hypothetical protein [Syntrophomonadaceae bacterium]
MKKICYLLVFLILFASMGCKALTPQKQGEEKKISPEKPVIFTTEHFITEKIEFTSPNFKHWYLRWFDDKTIAVIMHNQSIENPPVELIQRVYAYDLENKKQTFIFEGKFPFDFNVRLKKLANGDFLLQGSVMALEIESQTFKLKRIFHYPDGAYAADVSRCQEQILYIKEEDGLYLRTIASSKDIKLYSVEDERIRPAMPQWSDDEKTINYLLVNIGSYSENKFVFLNPITGKQSSFKVNHAYLGWWFQDNKRFVTATPGASFGFVPKIKVIDISSNQVLEFQPTDEVEILCPPHGDEILFEQKDLDVPGSKFPLSKLMILNVLTNTTEIVTPEFLNLSSSVFSPSGNKIAFLANFISEKDLSIYITKRKE